MPLQHRSCGRANEGELLARNYLMKELEHSDGILLTNYQYPFYNSTQEHDLVLINQQGVWAIEVKNWHGRIEADQRRWLRTNDDFTIDSPISSIGNKARYLATTLQRAGFENVSAIGMVVLTQSEEIAPIKFSNEPRQYTQFFRLQPRLINALTGRGSRYRDDNILLTPASICEIADMLVTCVVNPEERFIGDYRLLEELEPGEMFRAYKAKHRTMPDQYARIKKYHIPYITSSIELQKAADRFKRDMLTLQRLRHHPHIVRVENYFVDPNSVDIHWMIVEWSEGETLQDKLNRKEVFSIDEQLHIVRAVVDALEYCHEQGILHRNLTPSSIYITNDGDTIKLGDFDYARISNRNTTISSNGKPLAVNRYTSPELIANARKAVVRSDLYALGAIWYDMAISPPPNEPILISRIDDAALPDKAIELLTMLLENRQADRPKDATTVKRWLQQL